MPSISGLKFLRKNKLFSVKFLASRSMLLFAGGVEEEGPEGLLDTIHQGRQIVPLP